MKSSMNSSNLGQSKPREPKKKIIKIDTETDTQTEIKKSKKGSKVEDTKETNEIKNNIIIMDEILTDLSNNNLKQKETKKSKKVTEAIESVEEVKVKKAKKVIEAIEPVEEVKVKKLKKGG